MTSFDHERTLANPRPGAMTAVMQAARPANTGPRELRIGRVENGTIIDDRQYGSTLTYGRSEQATLMIPDAQARCTPLFERSAAGSFTLLVPRGARGRLALAAGAIDLAEVEGTSIPLDASARGKLVLGDTTLLFQLVPAASVALRPRLSSAVRGGFLSMIDWRFTSYVLASICAHFFFIAWLDSADFALDTSGAPLPAELARLVIEMPDPPPIPDDTRAAAMPPNERPAPSDVPEQSQSSQPSRSTQRTPSRTPSSTERPSVDDAARIAELQRRAELLIVGTFGRSDGALRDLVRTAVVGNAGDVLAGVQSVDIASGNPQVLRSRSGGGSGETGDIGVIRAEGHGATDARREGNGRPIETVVRPLPFVWEAPVQETGDRDPQEVVRLLRARRQAFSACYEQRTRVNPELQGKIAVEFTISEMGTVSHVRIDENRTGDAPLGLCVASVFERLRFGEATGSGDSTFAHAFVFAPQN